MGVITEKTMYQTTDGKLFEYKDLAERHQSILYELNTYKVTFTLKDKVSFVINAFDASEAQRIAFNQFESWQSNHDINKTWDVEQIGENQIGDSWDKKVAELQKNS